MERVDWIGLGYRLICVGGLRWGNLVSDSVEFSVRWLEGADAVEKLRIVEPFNG